MTSEYTNLYLGESARDAMNVRSLDLGTLALGTLIQLNLAEGFDLERQFEMTVQLEEPVQVNRTAAFRVVASAALNETIAINERYGLTHPDFVDELMIVNGGCTYRKGYGSPITMVHMNTIDQNRHLWTSLNTPRSSHGASMDYLPFVIDFQVRE